MENEKTLEVVEPTNQEVVSEETEITEEVESQVETEQQNEEVEEQPQEESFEFTEVTEENNTPVQSKDENTKFAQIRRKAEQEAAQKYGAKEKEAYERGRLDSFKGKINPYTNQVIEDMTDVQIYEDMIKLAEEGKDPILDYANYIANKQRAIEQKEREQKEAQLKAENEVNDFVKKYPDVNLNDLLKNEEFLDYAEGKSKPLISIYESFNKLSTSFRNKAVDVARQTIANAKSSPGSLGSGADTTVDYESMSSEEFKKVVKAVKDGDIK